MMSAEVLNALKNWSAQDEKNILGGNQAWFSDQDSIQFNEFRVCALAIEIENRASCAH